MTTEQEQRPVIQADRDAAWRKFELWFFRECNEGTRRHLFALFNLPLDEIRNHGIERVCLRTIRKQLLAQQPSATEAEPVATLPHFCQFEQPLVDEIVRQVQGISSIPIPNQTAIEVIAEAVWNGLRDSGFIASLAHPQAQPSGDVVERATLAIVNEMRWLQGFSTMSSLSEMLPHQYRDEMRYARAALAHQRPDEPGEVERLRKWLKHDGLCGIIGGYGYCTCGLDAALSAPTGQEGE